MDNSLRAMDQIIQYADYYVNNILSNDTTVLNAEVYLLVNLMNDLFTVDKSLPLMLMSNIEYILA